MAHTDPLSKVIDSLIHARGISQNHLAKVASIKAATLSRRMNSGDFTACELRRIALATNTTAAELLTEAERRAAL